MPGQPSLPALLATSLSRQKYVNRQRLLDKVKNVGIKGVLEKSLEGQALIALELEKRLNRVNTILSDLLVLQLELAWLVVWLGLAV